VSIYSLPRWARRVAFVCVAAVSGIAAFAVASGGGGSARSAPPAATHLHAVAAPKTAAPTAAEFGRDLIGVVNQYAQEHHDAARVSHADCVQASPGHYMCSYAVLNAEARRECHLMQGRWTPDLASSITVTLSGRSGRCGSLREALVTLR